jgi:hypothetical protein
MPIDEGDQEEELQQTSDSEEVNTICPEVTNEKRISPLETREEAHHTDISPSRMEVVKDATSGGMKRAHESENSKSNKEQLPLTQRLSLWNHLPGGGLRSRRRRGKETGLWISYILSFSMKLYFCFCFVSNLAGACMPNLMLSYQLWGGTSS